MLLTLKNSSFNRNRMKKCTLAEGYDKHWSRNKMVSEVFCFFSVLYCTLKPHSLN